MTIKKKVVITVCCAVILAVVFYRPLFVRTVNYEIGGIKIPSEYNMLTGKVKPILNYSGKAISRTVNDRKTGNVGLSEEQVVLAQFRWAVFEQWANSRPEYKGWQTNEGVFKKANDAFRKEIERSPKIRMVK